MSESVSRRINAAPLSTADKRELLALFQSIQGDMQALATQLNTVIGEATGSTAQPVTLNTTK